jgi:hypothetical protein
MPTLRKKQSAAQKEMEGAQWQALAEAQLQQLADKTKLEIHACDLPPGTSKWNKIEHRLFSHISINWRGKPLTSHEVIIDLISSTTTRIGLKVAAELDPGKYPPKIKVGDQEMASLNLVKGSASRVNTNMKSKI